MPKPLQKAWIFLTKLGNWEQDCPCRDHYKCKPGKPHTLATGWQIFHGTTTRWSRSGWGSQHCPPMPMTSQGGVPRCKSQAAVYRHQEPKTTGRGACKTPKAHQQVQHLGNPSLVPLFFMYLPPCFQNSRFLTLYETKVKRSMGLHIYESTELTPPESLPYSVVINH